MPERTWAAAVTVHDPTGRFVPGIERVGPILAELFCGVGVAGTIQTDEGVLEALGAHLPVAASDHEAGENRVGAARRQSVLLALDHDPAGVVYSDLDHLLRWAESDRREVERCLSEQSELDVVVVGRSPEAFAASPARLRETERLVNHLYELVTGRSWDLMFAIRRLSRSAAEAVVAKCGEDTLANDVEWPVVLERLGFSVGYFGADGLTYRTTSDFDTDADRRDGDPRAWIHRLVIAAGHAQVLGRLLEEGSALGSPW